jgi:proteasome lid subunit RPN8/RPN11
MLPEAIYPTRIVVVESALDAMWTTVNREYRRAGVEWGGLLWGTVYRAPNGEVVPVVYRVTTGVCTATYSSCELLPESWTVGRHELPPDRTWVNIGDYHSHPGFGVFMSTADCTSFWSWSHLPYWVGCVIDPLQQTIGFFAKRSPTEFARIQAWRAPDDHPESFR